MEERPLELCQSRGDPLVLYKALLRAPPVLNALLSLTYPSLISRLYINLHSISIAPVCYLVVVVVPGSSAL